MIAGIAFASFDKVCTATTTFHEFFNGRVLCDDCTNCLVRPVRTERLYWTAEGEVVASEVWCDGCNRPLTVTTFEVAR